MITIEGVGNKKDGYHPIQKRLNDLNGTQCGYCSPGMVMNMYSLMESSGDGRINMETIENSFGGNICRCTGYRPILDAFKSMAYDADQKLIDACMDIEDLQKICPKTGSKCGGICHQPSSGGPVRLTFADNKEWHKANELAAVFEILNKSAEGNNYQLVAGNTAHGVYRRAEHISLFIDINSVAELRSHVLTADSLTIGANVNLTETMAILEKASKSAGFEYVSHVMHHIDLIANVPVRNAGTIAGNLSIKHANPEFPSDMFITLESVGAIVTVAKGAAASDRTDMSVVDYLRLDMNRKVMLSIRLPRLDAATFTYRSYKVMPRAQNAHAFVNAGFLVEFKDGLVRSARICFGGIRPDFYHASATEKMLIGKDLYTNATLQAAIGSLASELKPDWVLPDAAPEYRRQLAMGLFYKFVLNTCDPAKVTAANVSGGEILKRDLSSGTQRFDTYEKQWPLTKPVKKLEGMVQCSGEAQFINDLPVMKDELWAAFVPATRPHTRIGKIDATEALVRAGG